MTMFNEKYWTDRYKRGEIQWDAGSITTPLKVYFDQLPNKQMKILIPGGGNGHEAAYLHEQGFENVYLLDISPLPLQNFSEKYPSFPEDHLLLQDFFQLSGSFDLMVEQTFFCALSPDQRPAYARKAFELLRAGGRLAGVLFNAPLNDSHPPFGGNSKEYLSYFTPFFTVHAFETCYNSIKPRQEKELWINLEAKGRQIQEGKPER